jgi:predicted small lipoprotein YifL
VRRRPRRAALAVVVVAAGALAAAGCGKKGPPLPPLVKLPAAPSGVTAARRATSVDITVTLPASNTDGTRPANVDRVDVYAITGPLGNATEDALIKYGTKIGSVAVKAPRDPNLTVDVDDPDSDIEPPEGRGLDQGATTHVRDAGTGVLWSAKPSLPPPVPVKSAAPAPPTPVGPLAGPPLTPPMRQYFAVGFNKRGRRGPLSRRSPIPLIDAPRTPPPVAVTYDESTITIKWSVAPPAAVHDGLLPSRSLVGMRTTNGYNVYKINAGPAEAGHHVLPDAGPAEAGRPVPTPVETKLTAAPLDDLPFPDPGFTWGAERCYVVRAVTVVAGVAVESDATSPACVTPVDTFPPAAPKQPTAIAIIGGINLLWDANDEKDLAGYIVLRRNAPGGTLTPVTPAPIDTTNFTDTVPSGTRAVYVLEAVDRAGNVSPPSPESDEETAR